MAFPPFSKTKKNAHAEALPEQKRNIESDPQTYLFAFRYVNGWSAGEAPAFQSAAFPSDAKKEKSGEWSSVKKMFPCFAIS